MGKERRAVPIHWSPAVLIHQSIVSVQSPDIEVRCQSIWYRIISIISPALVLEGKLDHLPNGRRIIPLKAAAMFRLIAIMLGRFSMTIDECIKAYEELIPNIFAKRRWLHFGNARVPRYKYDATNMETILQRFVEERSGKTNVIMKQPNEDMCRV